MKQFYQNDLDIWLTITYTINFIPVAKKENVNNIVTHNNMKKYQNQLINPIHNKTFDSVTCEVAYALLIS